MQTCIFQQLAYEFNWHQQKHKLSQTLARILRGNKGEGGKKRGSFTVQTHAHVQKAGPEN